MNCKVCGKKAGVSAVTSYLTCVKCECKVHQKCLSSIKYMKYPMIIGDIFYFFTCKDCNKNDELVVKVKPRWSDILLVVLYSLQEHSSNISRDGYFHWKVHICSFVNEHWKSLFGVPKNKRHPNWRASVSGTLSHFRSVYFKANETASGWWKLMHSFWPQRLIEICQKKKINDLEKAYETNQTIPQSSESNYKLELQISKNSLESETEVKDSADHATPNDSDSDDMLGPASVENMTLSTNPLHEALYDHDYCHHYIVPSKLSSNQIGENIPKDEHMETDTASETECPSTNSAKSAEPYAYSDFTKKLEDNEISALLSQVRNPVKTRKLRVSNLETIVNSIDDDFPRSCGFSEEEQNDILKRIYKLYRIIPKAEKYNVLRKLFRVLDVHRFRRLNCVSILSSRESISEDLIQEMSKKAQEDAREHYETVFTDDSHPNWFRNGNEWKSVSSPYTSRLLKPLIFRDYSIKPLWLQLMEEIRYAAFLKRLKAASGGNSQENIGYESIDTAIDYSYVSPHFLLALDSLSCRFFWPGIQLLECLHYPDFTCVATYKKLIIGFGIMIPNLAVNEAYITYLFVRPFWRKCGIATFIIYHLIQSCMGKDITLHVSADNDAIFLYQKFGFKIEDYILNFYDQYMLLDAPESRHAFFLRFSR